MAKDAEPLEMLNKSANRVAAEIVDQTHGAWDNYFNFMQKAFSSYPAANVPQTSQGTPSPTEEG
jgi:hypothetical protein